MKIEIVKGFQEAFEEGDISTYTAEEYEDVVLKRSNLKRTAREIGRICSLVLNKERFLLIKDAYPGLSRLVA